MLGKLFVEVLLCLSIVNLAVSLDNGLALTPPMGWLSWERFRCITDCQRDPNDCISEQLIRGIADRMVEDGYLDAGYEYVIVDDCWLARERDENGRLQPDPDRFPSGMKNLSDYVHSKGLKFGIYEDYGTNTCAGYPGIIENMEEDAKTLAEFGADYVKLDGCYADPMDMDMGYPEFGRYLNETGKKIIYSCSWPVYQEVSGMMPNFTLIAEHCNLWRNWDDIQDSWTSVTTIMNYFADNQDRIGPNAGPGHWNDPDMLIIGNYGLSYEQSKAQMAIWAILAAPLIMSHDLRNVQSEFRDILLNKEAIQINQDPLGIQGRRVYSENSIEIWTKPIQPVENEAYSYAVAILNKRTDGSPYWIDVPLLSIGLVDADYYLFHEVFGMAEDAEIAPGSGGSIVARIPPTGVFLYKAEAHKALR